MATTPEAEPQRRHLYLLASLGELQLSSPSSQVRSSFRFAGGKLIASSASFAASSAAVFRAPALLSLFSLFSPSFSFVLVPCGLCPRARVFLYLSLLRSMASITTRQIAIEKEMRRRPGREMKEGDKCSAVEWVAFVVWQQIFHMAWREAER